MSKIQKKRKKMKFLKNTTMLIMALTVLGTANVYEDAEDGKIDGWRALGNGQVKNIDNGGDRVIQLLGERRDSYILGGTNSIADKVHKWDAREGNTLSWEMNFEKNPEIYVAIRPANQSDKIRYIKYVSATDNDISGWNHAGSILTIKVPETFEGGEWVSVTRDVEADLQAYTHPNDPTTNQLVAINGFMVVGTGMLDDIEIMGTGNRQPTADAGNNQTLTLQDGEINIDLNGSASSDPDGDLITYNWSFVSKPEGSSAILSDFTTVNPTFTADINGTYTLQLIINDGQEDSVVDTVIITVLDQGSIQDPIAMAKVNDSNVTEGVLVTFDANSSYDPDGTILSYEWKENDIVLSSNKKFSLNTLTVGVHNIVLTVMDDDGLTGTDTIVVTVKKLTNQGVSFHTAFMSNFDTQMNLSFFISAKEDTTGEIKLYDTNETISFSVSAGDIEEVSIPRRMMLSGTNQETKVIEITSQKDIVVVGLSRRQYSTDAFLVLPDKMLSTNYYTLTYGNNNSNNYGKEEFAIVATEDNTIVNIVLPNGLGTFNVTLSKGETYQYQKTEAGNWLTGSHITSNKKIALLGGNSCVNIPQNQNVVACDHIVEQILPINTWENEFITVPLATRTKGDTFRILASQDNTTIEVNGSMITTLNTGEYYETILKSSNHIKANNPILVAQYSNSSSYDGVTSDPFMALVPALNQFDTTHIINTPSGFTDYINIVAPTTAINDVELDGVDIDASEFSVVTGTTYSSAQIQISGGKHTLISSEKIGILGYGYASYDSYGYPSSLRLVTH